RAGLRDLDAAAAGVHCSATGIASMPRGDDLGFGGVRVNNREDAMKSLAILAALGLCACATQAAAQSWRPPASSERCPSKWGAADERGSGNHMKPVNVLRAARLIKTGETFELGHVLGRDMPLNPGRQFDVHTKRSTGPFGANQRYSNEEVVLAEI